MLGCTEGGTHHEQREASHHTQYRWNLNEALETGGHDYCEEEKRAHCKRPRMELDALPHRARALRLNILQ